MTCGLILSSICIFLVGVSDSYLQLQVIALLVGLTTSVYHPVGFSLLSCMFKNKGKALGIHGASGSIGLVIFPIIAGIITEAYDWRLVFKLIPVIGLTTGLLFYMLTKNLREDKANIMTRLECNFSQRIYWQSFLSTAQLLWLHSA